MVRRTWSKNIVIWSCGDTRYYSIVFTWQLYAWSQTVQPELDGKKAVAGGPAVKLLPELVPEWVSIGEDMPALHRHNLLATKTSTGCPRCCPYCAVPQIEGDLRELAEWEPRPVLIDNNLLACSRKHFDGVIDRLKELPWCDFNQGLDARLLTKYHVERLSELRKPLIRLALDHTSYEAAFLRAFQLLRNCGIGKKNIQCYVLIGYRDTPEDALYRLRLVRSLGIKPNPMRYQPLNTRIRSEYVAPGWTDRQLIRFMSYWANLRYTEGVPFEEYVPHGQRGQAEMLSY